MNHDERDELWDLLGKARTPKERPFFAAKVMQAVREEETLRAEGSGWWAKISLALRRKWIVSLAGCSAVVLAGVLALSPETPQGKPVTVASAPADPLTGLITASDDVDQLAASLDNLLVKQDNSLWLQADLSSLY